MITPSRFHVNVTFGVPNARQTNRAEEPDSDADFELIGDRSITGLSVFLEYHFFVEPKPEDNNIFVCSFKFQTKFFGS